ncbi:glycosyltransferase family 2 protein [Bdellovibrio reynosensis]|uniref:Glycosyltransferase family 2 protein n=1 Tax=Bdellovibrio reynosensis TaxID=2835041 RepID=A0ABY4CDV0_9BACT|nr:glycosyltransferase family 2 protein [Bdellovibrio reynosensis]UOF01846.1 glycosyltransferase family 2 protein [Bdellovibrio reynosensis]
MILIEFLFWMLFAAICLHYAGFGLIVLGLARLFPKKHKTAEIYPSVSFIIAAYNEEKIIREKIRNDLKLDYPKDKLEIIVVSDGSSDSTPLVVKEFAEQGVIGLYEAPRKGKTAALNRAVALAQGEVLIFSDANSMFRPDAIKKLVRHFADESVGGVCGRKSVLTHGDRKASLGDNLYWHYESALKQAESHLGSIPTADGEIFALKRSLYQTVPTEFINDDLVITFNIIEQGKRVIYDKEAITEEQASITLKDDFNVKSRMVYGGIQVIMAYKKLLSPFASWFGFQFFIHKTLRYFMWLLLASIYSFSAMLTPAHWFYEIFFLLQTAFYFMALIGYVLDKNGKKAGPFYLPYYYCNVNFAAAKGFLFFLKQRSTVDIWKKAQR